MMDGEEQLKKMILRAEQRERKRRRNVLLYTLVPVALAIGLLVVTGWQVQKASQALATSEATLKNNQATLSVVEATLTDTNKTLSTVRSDLTNTNNTLVAANNLVTSTKNQAADAQKELIQLRQTLTKTNITLNEKNDQLVKLQKQVDELSAQLKLAKHFEDYYYPGDLMTDVYKHAWNMAYDGRARPGIGELADKNFNNMEVDFRINGTSFAEGLIPRPTWR